MEPKLTRQIRILQFYAFFLTLVVAALALLLFLQSRKTPHFKEIDAERINIVENDGTLRLVISNKQLQHPGRMDGKDMPHRERDAGMIFFNDEGDECGGLTYGGDKNGRDMTYSVDQFKNDQVMQLNYSEDTSGSHPVRSYGLRMWDESDKMPFSKLQQIYDSLQQLHDTAVLNAALQKMRAEGLFMKDRLFLGKNRNKEYGLIIRDDKGRVRIKLGLDSLNKPIFETLDTNGIATPFHF